MPKPMRQKRIGNTLTILGSYGRSMFNYTIGDKEGEIFSIETQPNDYIIL